MLSVIIITKNEALHIARCLESVAWADEIIVLDSGSTDATVEICRRHTDKVFQSDWPGFGIQKQRALDKAQGDWVLSIDADEIVTPELKNQIELAVQSGRYDAYQINRLSSYCGRQIRHGGWWPDYVLRLFRRQKGYFSEALVHEQIHVDGAIGRIETPLLHESFVNLEEVLHKVDGYSTLNAEMLHRRGVRSSPAKAIVKALWNFFRTYLLKLSILDGAEGLMLAISNAEGSYYKYAKLWLLQKKLDSPGLISVIVSTYNRPDALDMSLKSLLQQTDRNFEILIADDGSTEATRQLIGAYRAVSPVPIKHVYQPDQGFQLSRIRNKAVAESRGDYLIFVDGDCMARPNFVAAHRRLAESGWFVAGNRVLLGQAFTDEILSGQKPVYLKKLPFFVGLRLTGKINRFFPVLALPLGFLRHLQPHNWRKAVGCNTSFWKSDFIRANGYDELFEGWGHEDSDLVIRLLHAGIKRKEGRFAAPVLHLWHPVNDKSRQPDNYQRLMERLAQQDFTAAELGVAQYLPASPPSL
ncbi:glycosyltransferase [Methylomicrobium sp. Wu6]|uniref:glycosyltransferase family 2 protein n=1 Tax=Methylomicrobium sp. Wu6 TaxID=3107928 RepID=UPI002DD68BA0|nr:glycosyltransferase [Methylomicrobium sp. Wu6]MEC4748762.1 glycosyltransferase [Methylomicrobium sp. Wu6]